jgi:DNA-binding Lrp family transcriptional regulator
LILSTRDIQFLKDLYCVKFLNSTRICKLYNSKKYYRRRIKELEDNGYIKKVCILFNRESVYSIDKNGYNVLGYKDTNIKLDNLYSLAHSDFYFYEKRNNAFVKINNQYYFNLNDKKYVLKIEVLLKTNIWAFVIFNLGDKHLEEQVSKIEKYYKSKEYKKLFENFPIIIIITDNIDRDKLAINNSITINEVNYKYINYDQIKDWEYHY